MAEQQTTRDLWAAEGPFTHYEIARSRERNVHADYEKAARFDTINGDLGYHAKSNIIDEEGDEERYFAVEFNPARICWVEIRWIENLREGGHWEAFRIAASDLGLDITVDEATSAQDRAEAAARAQRISRVQRYNSSKRRHPIKSIITRISNQQPTQYHQDTRITRSRTDCTTS